MSRKSHRHSLAVRPALPVDVPGLLAVWSDVLRPGPEAERRADLEALIAEATSSEDRMVVVAEIDGEVAGAVCLSATTVTPLNRQPAVYAVSPHVLPQFRRRGAGAALMDAAVSFAEDRGIELVASAAAAEWRDANRFLARLSLVPQAMLRVAPTAVVRSRLSAARPGRRGRPRPTSSVDRVVAARRNRRGEGVPGR